MIRRAINRVSEMFGYDGAVASNRRRTVASRIKSSDDLLPKQKRKQLIASTQDLQRNFAIAGWAIRRHLDYVSSFHFHPNTGDDALDDELSRLMDWFARPKNCDVQGKHSLPKIIRMTEERRTVDGDILLVKLSSGLIQAVEGDRIRDPDNLPTNERWVQGVRLSKGGRASSYAVHSRNSSGNYEFERKVSQNNAWHFGYFDRFDQVRGISPLAPAVNAFRDVYEGIEYALAKAKVSQMLGLVFTSGDAEGVGGSGYKTVDDGDTDHEDSDRYEVDLGPAPWKLELDPGDKAEIVESRNPSSEFQAFMQTVIGAALKCLDIPFSFYDESFTNFFGSKAAMVHYDKACKSKRDSIRALLLAITVWRLNKFVADGDLVLPGSMTVAQLAFDWVHSGTPWWDPAKEIRADVMAINAGLTTRSAIVRQRYGDVEWRTIIDNLAAEEAYMEAAGVPIVRGTTWQPITETEGDTDDNDVT